MCLTLVIKGDAKTAAQQCAARHIPITEMIPHPKFREVIVRTDEYGMERIAQDWFCELPHEWPYPDGHLLFYCISLDMSGWNKAHAS